MQAQSGLLFKQMPTPTRKELYELEIRGPNFSTAELNKKAINLEFSLWQSPLFRKYSVFQEPFLRYREVPIAQPRVLVTTGPAPTGNRKRRQKLR